MKRIKSLSIFSRITLFPFFYSSSFFLKYQIERFYFPALFIFINRHIVIIIMTIDRERKSLEENYFSSMTNFPIRSIIFIHAMYKQEAPFQIKAENDLAKRTFNLAHIAPVL